MIQFILVLWFTIIITNTLIIKWIMWSLCHLLQICILSEIKLQLLNSTGIKGQFASKRNTSNESRKQCNKGTVKLLNTSKCNKVLHFLYDKIIYSIRVFNYTYSIFFCSGSFLFNQWGKQSQRLPFCILQLWIRFKQLMVLTFCFQSMSTNYFQESQLKCCSNEII